jgi:hypothetical protein
MFRECTCAVLLLFVIACTDDSDPGSDAGFDASFDAALDPMGLDGGFLDVPPDAPLPTMRVLFVGNSYTYFNDLPYVISQIGEASSTPMEVEMIAVGGATLYDHFTTTGARERIEMGGLDAVVLQGQSMEASVLTFTLEMFPEVLADTNNVWFATWARDGSHFFDPDLGPASMNASNERGYRDAAELAGGVVARVGGAWEIARMEMPDVRLHQDDGSHPRPEGSLIAACVIHQTLTGRTPILPEATPYGLDRDLAGRLCALASRVTCPFETADCDGACIGVVDDPDNCGGCGITCEGEDPCVSGTCGCPFEGQTGCDREYCARFSTDETDCGGCGVECSGGEACTGTCECPETRVYDFFGGGLPPCDFAGTDRVGCNAAARDYCAGYECFTGGYAFPTGHAPTAEKAVCIADTEERSTTLTELATHEPTCTEALTPACVTAIHRYCVSEGFASGYGPIEQTETALTVTCLPTATLYTATTETLQGFASRCVPDPITCGVAAWNWCEAAFHPGGYGPVEPDTVVCF